MGLTRVKWDEEEENSRSDAIIRLVSKIDWIVLLGPQHLGCTISIWTVRLELHLNSSELYGSRFLLYSSNIVFTE